MTGTALAKRYPQFIVAFEKAVEEAQKRVEEARNSEVVYNICREALMFLDLPHDITLAINGKIVSIRCPMPVQGYVRDLEPLIERIGQGLIRAGLRNKDYVPQFTGCSYTNDVDCLMYVYRQGEKLPQVKTTIIVTVKLDLEHGCQDWAVVSDVVERTETIHRTVRRSELSRKRDEPVEDIPF